MPSVLSWQGGPLCLGNEGTACLIVPPAIMAALLPICCPAYGRLRHEGHRGPAPGGRGKQGPLVSLCLSFSALLVRSVTFYGLNTFLPLFWIHVLTPAERAGGRRTRRFSHFNDRGELSGRQERGPARLPDGDDCGFSPRRVPSSAAPCHVEPSGPDAPLVPIGVLLSLPFSAMVVLGLSYLPSRIGLASGITLGLAYSFGGLATPALGWIADRDGLRATMGVIAFLPLPCLALSLMLPAQKNR